MRLIIHLIRADARRFAVPIALWIAITAGATTMDGLGPWMTADRDSRDLLTLATLVTWMTGTCVGAMLVALVVQQHPALGSNAWWMTRPVTPRMLLASRLLLLGLVILGVPAVCEAVLMAAYGVAPGQMLRVVLESCLAGLFALSLLMVAASVTTSLARFALLLGGCAVVLVVGLNIALTIAVAEKTPFQYWSISGFAGALIARPEEPTPMVLAWAVSIMTAMWLLRTLYTHGTRASVAAIGGMGGVVAIIVAVGWPWPLLHAEPGAPAWANALDLEAPPQSLYFDNAGFPVRPGPRWRTAFARVYITGVPEGWIAAARLRNGTLRFDGRQLLSGPFKFVTTLNASGLTGTAAERALQHVLGVTHVAGANASGGTIPLVTALSPAVPSAKTAATYHGEFDVDILHFEEAAALPLRSGATFEDGSFRLVIDDVQSPDRAPVLRVLISRASASLDRRSPATFTYFLRNRRAGDAYAGELQAWRPPSIAGSFAVGRQSLLGSPFGFTVNAGYLRFPTIPWGLASSGAAAGTHQSPDQQWLDGAELVIVRTVDAGTVVRRLEITGLTIDPQ